MAFIRFTDHGRSFAAKASISRTGMLSFSDGARKRFDMDTRNWCVLYYDPDTRRIGVEFTADQDVEGARRVRLRNTGADVAAKSFTEYFNIGVPSTIMYPVEIDDDSGFAVIDMDKGKARVSRRARNAPSAD